MTEFEPTIECALESAWQDRLLGLGFRRTLIYAAPDARREDCLRTYTCSGWRILAAWRSDRSKVAFEVLDPQTDLLRHQPGDERGFVSVSPACAYQTAINLIKLLHDYPGSNTALRTAACGQSAEHQLLNSIIHSALLARESAATP